VLLTLPKNRARTEVCEERFPGEFDEEQVKANKSTERSESTASSGLVRLDPDPAALGASGTSLPRRTAQVRKLFSLLYSVISLTSTRRVS